MAFSAQTLDFLFENMINDSKIWFNEHKDDYNKYVIGPMKEFSAEIAPAMHEIDELMTCARISRIYRDARYSKGKSIFRENMWGTYSRTRDLYKSLPAFFFDISSNGFEYGCGYYVPSSDSMDCMRKLILEDAPSFTAALDAFSSQDTFELYGDLYKKNRYPDEPEEKYLWLNRKNIGLTSLCKDWDLVFSNKLAEKVADDFKRIAPVYDFWLKAEELAADPDI